MKFLYCVLYVALLGILCFPAGRLIARFPFRTDRFPFRQTRFEQEKKPYDRLHLKDWQNRVPDVSRILSSIVPRKELSTARPDREKLELMIRETCVAELVHVLLCFLGIPLLLLWPGAGGIVFFVLYVIPGNLPFILIQRYNRPRLLRLLSVQNRKNETVGD